MALLDGGLHIILAAAAAVGRRLRIDGPCRRVAVFVGHAIVGHAIEQHAVSLWPQAAAATNLGDWPRVHGLLDELHSVIASSELTAETRENLEAGIGLVLDRLPAPRSIFDAPAASVAATGSGGDEEQSCATDASGDASSSAGSAPVVGLMITKDDENVLREWLEANGALLDGLVLLDGSRSNASRDIVREHVARSAHVARARASTRRP